MRLTVISAITMATVLALAACHAPSQQGVDNAAAADNASNAATGATNAAAAVLALPEAQRDAVFLRAITDAGLSCQAISKTERLPDEGGKPNWRATCSDGSAHLIDLSPDGTAVITSRTTP